MKTNIFCKNHLIFHVFRMHLLNTMHEKCIFSVAACCLNFYFMEKRKLFENRTKGYGMENAGISCGSKLEKHKFMTQNRRRFYCSGTSCRQVTKQKERRGFAKYSKYNEFDFVKHIKHTFEGCWSLFSTLFEHFYLLLPLNIFIFFYKYYFHIIAYKTISLIHFWSFFHVVN